MKSGPRYLTTFFSCVGLFGGRSIERLLHPDIWAEDGTIFIPQALEAGYQSLLMPLMGSWHTLQRAVVFLGMKALPLAWLPALFWLVYVVLFAAVVSMLVRDSYRWILPDRRLRFTCALALCFCPGLNEMSGNLCNLNWVLFFGIAFVGLKDPDLPLLWWEILFSLMCIWSIGTAVLLIPLFSLRLFDHTRQKRSTTHLFREAVLLLLLLVGVVFLIALRTSSTQPLGVVLRSLPLVISHATRGLLISPWLGDGLARNLFNSPAMLLFQVLFLALVGVYLFRSRNERWGPFLNVFFGVLLLWPILCWMARAEALDTFRSPPAHLSEQRYSFSYGMVAVLSWLTAFRKSRWAYLFLLIFCCHSLHRFQIKAYGPDRRWAAGVWMIQPGVKGTVEFPIYPNGWNFKVTL